MTSAPNQADEQGEWRKQLVPFEIKQSRVSFPDGTVRHWNHGGYWIKPLSSLNRGEQAND